MVWNPRISLVLTELKTQIVCCCSREGEKPKFSGELLGKSCEVALWSLVSHKLYHELRS
jgi:hypothetical protein